MSISYQQFIQLLADKLGRTTEEVSEELDQLIEQIKTDTAKGDEFVIEKFGTFKVKNGRLSFEVDSTFALEINYKYAGMTPVELKGGKTASVSDEELTQQSEEEPPDATESADENRENLKEPGDEEIEDVEVVDIEDEDTEEDAEEIFEKPQLDWVTHSDVSGAEDEELNRKREHALRSPNRLMHDEEVPKRRTGLFVVIVLVIAVLSAGYYVIVQQRGAPVVDNNQNLVGGDTVYVHDENTKPEIRNTERNAKEDTVAAMQSGMTSDSTQLTSNMSGSGNQSTEISSNEKKSVPAHTASISASVAAKDSAYAKDIMSDLSGGSLYGLHGKASNDIGDYYTIVIASLRDQNKAQNVGKRWKSQNYRVVIAPGQVHDQTWYRVGLGQFSTIPEAQDAVKELPDRLQDNQHHFIRRIHK